MVQARVAYKWRGGIDFTCGRVESSPGERQLLGEAAQHARDVPAFSAAPSPKPTPYRRLGSR